VAVAGGGVRLRVVVGRHIVGFLDGCESGHFLVCGQPGR
jgi:hypothetical protein